MIRTFFAGIISFSLMMPFFCLAVIVIQWWMGNNLWGSHDFWMGYYVTTPATIWGVTIYNALLGRP